MAFDTYHVQWDQFTNAHETGHLDTVHVNTKLGAFVRDRLQSEEMQAIDLEVDI